MTTSEASLSKTKILSLPLDNGNHFIGYSNSVKNESGKPNAMILPIPGRTKPEWFHNTKKYKSFLDDIVKAATLENWLGMRSRGTKSMTLSLGDTFGYEKFQLGMYTVGLANSFEGIGEFIASLPEDQQPEISEELRTFFINHYAGWSFAVCCFDSNKAIDAQPIAFEYTPSDPSRLFFPTMDAHDGGAPDLGETIKVDHSFIFEHTGRRDEQYAMEHIELKDVPDFLNKRKYRFTMLVGKKRNGDTFINIEEMNAMEFSQNPAMERASEMVMGFEG